MSSQQRYLPPGKIALALILLLAAAAYSQVIFMDFSGYDDDIYLQHNPLIKNLTWEGLRKIFTSSYPYYIPFTNLTWAIEYRFFGLTPLVFHLNNVALHLINIVLCCLFISKLTGRRSLALFTSAFFALHPLHTESVTWITERKDVLFTAFYLAALIAYLLFRQKNQTRYYGLTFCLFVASLLSKPAALTLPVVLSLVDYYVKGDWQNSTRLLQKIPFLALSLLTAFVTYMSVGTAGEFLDYEEQFNLIGRITIFFHTLFLYLKSALALLPQCVIHPFPGQLLRQHYLSVLWIIIIAATLFVAAKRTNPKSVNKDWIFGLGLFITGIAMYLNLMPASDAIIGERYTYIPLIGIYLAAGSSIRQLACQSKRIQTTLYTGTVLLTLLCASATYHRNQVWANGESLFADVIRKYPHHTAGHFGLGNYLMSKSDVARAVQQYNKALELDSTFAMAYNNRGNAHLYLKQPNKALADYARAIALDETYAPPLNNRASIREARGQYAQALADYLAFLRLTPRDARTLFNCGRMLEQTNDYHQAILYYNQALANDSLFKDAYLHRGRMYYYTGDNINACRDWREAGELGETYANELLVKYCRK